MAVKYVTPATVLCGLSSEGNLEKIRQFIDATTLNINVGDYDGRTALHLAAEEGHLEVVKYLVSIGM